MDVQTQLIEWFRKMGYDGNIPESLWNICNNSTAFIWTEIMQNAKPNQEVDNIKKNIIIHRLRNKPLKKQGDFSYPIKEIEAFKKRQDLQKHLDILRANVNNKRYKLNNLSQSNKIKCITIDQLKGKIRENEEREFLLNKKSDMLGNDIHEIEDILTTAKNLTPVELEDTSHSKDITETLQECAKKLEKLLQDFPITSNEHHSKIPLTSFSSTHKPKGQSAFEKYLCLSEKKHEQIIISRKATSTHLRLEFDKENIFKGREDSKFVGRLSEVFEMGQEKITANLLMENSEIKKSTKRESLGLLPDSYLSEESDVNFLMEGTNFLSPAKKSTKIKAGFHLSAISDHAKIEDQFNSIVIEINDQPLVSESKKAFFNHTRVQKEDSLQRICSDKFVTEEIRGLLHKYNRQMIWNSIQALHENLNLEFAKTIVIECENGKGKKKISQDNIARLQFIHIQTELEILKQKNVIRELTIKINKRKAALYSALQERGIQGPKLCEIQRVFEMQLKDISMDALLAAMKKEIHSVNKFEDISDLQITLGKINNIKEEILLKLSSIRHYIENIKKTLHSTEYTKENTVACVQKLTTFSSDMAWAQLLTEDLCSKEVKLFEKYPLNYNRRCNYTDPKVFYRDLCLDNVPNDVELDDDQLYMISEILESPFSPPETILLNIIKAKKKLDILKSIPNYTKKSINKKYSLKELESQERYINYALDKLNSIYHSASSLKTLSASSVIKNNMELYVEMPLKDFILPSRLVKGKDYKFYEKQFEGFCENI